jgi:hypothetical protein
LLKKAILGKIKPGLYPYAFLAIFMFFRLLSFSSLIVLASCAYALEKHIQDVRIETPGAENAICNMYVEDLRYKVRPPQTVNISKSMQDLIIDCQAPGNRRQKVVIKPQLSGLAKAEAPLIAPFIWDVAAASAHKYPDLITVDFTYMPVKPEALPAQNRPDVKQPEEYPLEEFLPGRPRLNSDGDELPFQLQRREKPGSSIVAPDYSAPYMVEEGTGSDKGALKNATTYNPAGPPSRSAEPDTVGPAYPGQ